MWDFSTEPEFQAELDWIDEFVRTEVEPLDFVIDHPSDLGDPVRRALIPPLQQIVKDRKLWATHLAAPRSCSEANRQTRETPRSWHASARMS
jgi:acyl-CoA dehydrogenase